MLKVHVRRGDGSTYVERVPDPRHAFCRVFNEMHPDCHASFLPSTWITPANQRRFLGWGSRFTTICFVLLLGTFGHRPALVGWAFADWCVTDLPQLISNLLC
jgi:hypothetical protein